MTPPAQPPSWPGPGASPGDWSTYGFYILDALNRLTSTLESLQSDVQTLLSHQAADKREQSQLRAEFEAFRAETRTLLTEKDIGLVHRVEMIEEAGEVSRAFVRGKVWVFASAFTVFTAIVLPTLALVLKG